MSYFISERLHSFIQVATQNHVDNSLILLQEECYFYVNQYWVICDAVKKLQEHAVDL
jgi:hypothetical protein